jgi:PPOX class probable F420-dependent enzyme
VIIPDSHRDLLEAAGIGLLTTVGSDGLPQSTAVWYLLEDEVVRATMVASRQKFKNLQRHPKATLFVFDPANIYRTIEVRADVTMEPDADLAFVRRIVTAYGADFDSFEPRDDRWVITLTPVHVVASG